MAGQGGDLVSQVSDARAEVAYERLFRAAWALTQRTHFDVKWSTWQKLQAAVDEIAAERSRS